MPDSLRGQLLVAAPSLFDYFRRTVILVVEHTAEGAMGVVINRPTDLQVSDAVPQLAELAGESELVRVGGPVAPQAVVAIGEFEDPGEAGSRVVGALGTLDPDGPNASLTRLRVYAGYAGWAPGQLEGELEEGVWIVVDAEPDDLFQDGDVWSQVLRRNGAGYTLLATMPADPSLN